MVNEEHLAILKKGVKEWNKWREENRDIRPDFRSVKLISADLISANLSSADLISANFHSANLRNAKLISASLSYAKLSYAKLRSADLRNADLSNANLSNANLRNADLRSANLRSANLRFADLRSADLRSANLRNADLRNADLYNARFSYTKVVNVDLSNIKNLDTMQHDGPSDISTNTFQKSEGQISTSFLKGCGLSDWEIESVKLYQPGLSPEKVVDIIYKIEELRNAGPIQLFSVFLSHAHEDKAFTYQLQQALDARGVRCWLDEKQLNIGEKIIRGINTGIALYDKSILICSKSSLTSSWVNIELERILEKERELNDGKKEQEKIPLLLPITLDDYFMEEYDGDWKTEIKKRKVGDFKDCMQNEWKFNQGVDLLIKALRVNRPEIKPPSHL